MNILDSFIGVFSPEKALKRVQARNALEVVRSYDASDQGGRLGGWFRPKTTAAQEVSKASESLAATGQDLGRNNPLAKRIKRTWGNAAVGKGITLDVIGSSENKSKKFNERFDTWAEGTDCDFEGHHTLYGLQW